MCNIHDLLVSSHQVLGVLLLICEYESSSFPFFNDFFFFFFLLSFFMNLFSSSFLFCFVFPATPFASRVQPSFFQCLIQEMDFAIAIYINDIVYITCITCAYTFICIFLYGALHLRFG